MSDFDREAEREKLREKYEADKEKREASERMSELLLQGATMTNQHCPECHSPVFRYDGQEFCPTCQSELTEDGQLQDAEAEAQTSTDAETGQAKSTVSKGDYSERDESSSEPATQDAAADGSPPTPASDRRPARVDPPARREGPADQEESNRDIGDRGRSERAPSHHGELRDAEDALVAEIGSLTRQAAETRDIGRKRDLLAAAREAADTLEAIRRL